MRYQAWAIVLLCIAVFAGSYAGDQGWAQPSGSGNPTGRHPAELIALTSDNETHQQITVIDTKSRVMSVYQVERVSGTITLKSVRNIEADLLMDEFNTDSPLPREIRAMLTTR